MAGFGLLITACIYLMVIINRDKRDRKRFREIGKMLEQERKRRVKEEKLRSVRVNHPKVAYLDDYRPSPTKQRIG